MVDRVTASYFYTIATIRTIGRRIIGPNTVLVRSIARESIRELQSEDVVTVEAIALQGVDYDCRLKSVLEISET